MSDSDAFKQYDRRTNAKMRQHNAEGGHVRKPVRKVKGASDRDLYDRAKFNSRKAAQILKRGDPLVDDKGNPTPAALQFKRWAEKVPKTKEDLRAILSRANTQKDRYRTRLEHKDSAAHYRAGWSTVFGAAVHVLPTSDRFH